MPNPENLEKRKPFKKNDPRINRKGRPKLPDISEALEKVLNEEKDGMIALDAVLKALRNKAIKGDVRAIAEILDRTYGKAKQNIDLGVVVPEEWDEEKGDPMKFVQKVLRGG